MKGLVVARISSISSMIGDSSLVQMKGLVSDDSIRIFAKVESRNPGGSVKDRIARGMIDDAERKGLITCGECTIVEPTSGNTGIALAMIGAERGYKVVLTMPESMSLERRKMLMAFGAKVVLTPAANGMAGAVAQAEKIVRETPKAWMPSQFTNPANPASHFTTTGPEIKSELGAVPDYFIAGVGTGGTVSGVGNYLKDLKPSIKIIAVEPAESPIIGQALRGEEITPSPHGIQGIGANFIPDTLDLAVLDEALSIPTAKAIEISRWVAREKGFAVGISAGANIAAVVEVAKRGDLAGKTIVTVLPDTGERYLSTALWADLGEGEKA